MVRTVPMAELVKKLRKRGEIAFTKDYSFGFLEVVYLPPSTAGYQDGDTAETRLGGSPRSRSLAMEKTFVPLVKSDDDPDRPSVTLGRTADNDIVIDAWGISKRHARFAIDDQGRVWLLDLGSSNGTTINGTGLEAQTPVQLHSGDAITFWWYVFEFVYPRHMINAFKEVL